MVHVCVSCYLLRLTRTSKSMINDDVMFFLHEVNFRNEICEHIEIVTYSQRVQLQQ